MRPPDWFLKAVNAVHRPLFRATKGRIAGRGLGMPVLDLTTTGRKSGQPRSVMLTAPIVDGDVIVLVASKGGADEHPAWYLNVRDDPQVEVTMRGETKPMVARIPEGAERDELWTRLTAAHKNYAGYQRKTERQIPVVVLEPVGRRVD